MFTSHSTIFHLKWRPSPIIAGEGLHWKIWPMLGAQGLWEGRDLYLATPAVTRGLGFSGLIRRTAPIPSPLTTWGCRGSIFEEVSEINMFPYKSMVLFWHFVIQNKKVCYSVLLVRGLPIVAWDAKQTRHTKQQSIVTGDRELRKV
jgi:hypothetical protein